MTKWQRFGIGGGGALLPVIVTLLGVDLGYMIDHFGEYTIGIYIGTLLRYTLLFVLGGIVASLNSTEDSPIKLVQIGIAAPALVASYVNAQPRPAINDVKESAAISFGMISSANAMDVQHRDVHVGPLYAYDKKATETGAFFTDVLRGLKGGNNSENLVQQAPLHKGISDAQTRAVLSAAAAEEASKKAAQDAIAAKNNPTRELIAIAQKSAAEAARLSQQAAEDARAAQFALPAR